MEARCGKRLGEDSDSDDQDLAYSESENESTTDSDSDTHAYDQREVGRMGLECNPVRKSSRSFEKLPKECQDLIREFDEEVAAILKPSGPKAEKATESPRKQEEVEGASAAASSSNPEDEERRRKEFIAKMWQVEDVAEDDTKSKDSKKSEFAFMFDEESDERDERAIEAKRRAYLQPASTNSGSSKQAKGVKGQSDARLDCPGCMTTLCYDSQRHEIYRTQYRAMFVEHCVTDLQAPLTYAAQRSLSGSNKRKAAALSGTSSNAEAAGGNVEVYYTVRCEICSTQVGVMDTDEVYHFFNILASHS